MLLPYTAEAKTVDHKQQYPSKVWRLGFRHSKAIERSAIGSIDQSVKLNPVDLFSFFC